MRITDLLDKIETEICDKYCKNPEKYDKDDDALIDEHCNNCPLNMI